MPVVKVGMLCFLIDLFLTNCVGIVSAEDDEYRWAGAEDPKVIVTTSHDPSSKLKQFSKVCPLKIILSENDTNDDVCLLQGIKSSNT